MGMTTANKITIVRILLVPFFVVEVLNYVGQGRELHHVLAIAAFQRPLRELPINFR